jgi:hypothetical protein
VRLHPLTSATISRAEPFLEQSIKFTGFDVQMAYSVIFQVGTVIKNGVLVQAVAVLITNCKQPAKFVAS